MAGANADRDETGPRRGDAPYRGSSAWLEEAATDLRGRATQLGSAKRRLPRELRRELSELDAELTSVDTGRPAATDTVIQRYHAALDAAFAIVEARQETRHRTRFRRWAMWATAAAVLCGSGIYVHHLWGIYLDRDASCVSSDYCTRFGRCHARVSDVVHGRPNTCIARSQADCEPVCVEAGLCHFSHEGCAAHSDADCKQSARCRELGECHKMRSFDVGGLWGGRYNLGGEPAYCVIRTDEDCRQSAVCREEGRCYVGDTECAQSGL